MNHNRVLIVDDEPNIRLTLSQALASLAAEVDTAEDGSVALTKIKQQPFAAVLLDLRMPGLDGMEVLRQLRDSRPDLPVIIISAHGTVESAVEAMKLGAIDMLQKPFSPHEVRQVVRRVLDRQRLKADAIRSYAEHFELAKRCISERHLAAAVKHALEAVALAPNRPEALNLLGALHHLQHRFDEAREYYRMALSLDPASEAADANLSLVTSGQPFSRPVRLGELRP